MKLDEFNKRSDELVSKMRETTDFDEKAELNRLWWTAAAETFNEELAGEITTVTGRKIIIPEI